MNVLIVSFNLELKRRFDIEVSQQAMAKWHKDRDWETLASNSSPQCLHSLISGRILYTPLVCFL